MSAPRPASLPALTGLRFVAAAVVLCEHSAPPVLSSLMDGSVAVTLFFLLSGFILTYNAPERVSLRAFYVARIARIYPVYVLGLLLGALALSSGTPGVGPGCASPRAAALPLVLLVQGWVPSVTYCVNSPAWTLSCEAFFYALFPLLLMGVRRMALRRLGHVVLLCWSMTLALPLIFLALHPTGPSELLALRLIHSVPVAQLPAFIFGMILGHIFVRGVRLPRPALWICLALASVPVIAMLVPNFAPLRDAAFWPTLAILLLALAQGQGTAARVLTLPAVALLGEASYGLYILHMPLLSLVKNLGLVSPGWGAWPAFLAGAVVCVAASLLSLRFVETPCRRAIRAWLAPTSPWPQDRATCVREARVEDLAPRMVG